ncbi:odorant receptor 49b-like [Venturia canescens]|uniref:odorant receptor 49b-like n=1 Tax=Venturia canescens TaxID=32260 RepID=UPI001C9BF76F|nr:odorant receptor 49b-like [Venturia canescens]
MCIYRRERPRLGHLAVSLDNCIKNGPSDVLKNLEDYGKICSLACGSLLVVSWLLTVVFLSAPILLNERVLPFASYYPFDYDNSTILYVIAYGHEAVLTCLGCCTMSTEITFVWSIFHCCSRLRVLRHELSNLSNLENNDDEKFPDKISSKLSSLMDLHYEVLRDLVEINLAYTYITSVLFFAALIAICCAGLQITGSSLESSNWTAGLFLVLAMYYAEQLLFYYLPGEIVAQEAMGVAFAAYTSGWETLDVKYRKTIGLIIMRSQLPPRLFVGQLIPLRLENYGAFLTTTASYFTSIRAVA